MKDIESKLSSKQKGEISENRVAEIITLGSAGRLSCFRPISDDDGLDLIVCPKGEFKPLFIQIKSRFKLQKNNRFIQNVGFGTFTPHKSFYLAFLLFNEERLEVDAIWLIPSIEFQQNAYFKKEGDSYKAFYRFNANSKKKTAEDRWAKYLTDKTGFVDLVYKAIDETYKQ